MSSDHSSGETARGDDGGLFYIRVRGRVDGPFDPPTLQSMARRGRFARHYEISQDRQSWYRASEFPELFPARSDRRAVRGPAANAESAQSFRLEQAPQCEVAPSSDETNAPAEPAMELDAGASRPEPSWYYATSAGEKGPITEAQLRKLLTSGELAEDCFVWSAAMPDWVPARDLGWNDSPARADAPTWETGRLSRHWTTAQTSGMAVASLVLGIVSIGLLALPVIYVLTSTEISASATMIRGVALGVVPLFGAVLAIVFGHIGVAEIRRRGGRRGGRGLALAGLIMGYGILFVFAVIGIVVGFLLFLGAVAAGRA